MTKTAADGGTEENLNFKLPLEIDIFYFRCLSPPSVTRHQSATTIERQRHIGNSTSTINHISNTFCQVENVVTFKMQKRSMVLNDSYLTPEVGYRNKSMVYVPLYNLPLSLTLSLSPSADKHLLSSSFPLAIEASSKIHSR